MIREDGDGVRFVNLSEERANRKKDPEVPNRSIEGMHESARNFLDG